MADNKLEGIKIKPLELTPDWLAQVAEDQSVID